MSKISAHDGEFSVHEAGGTLYVSWRCKDRRVWEQLKSSFRAIFPHWSGAAYDGGWRAWKVPLHQRHRLATWADAWFADAAQYWDGERPGTGRRREQAHEPPKTSPPLSTLSQAYHMLHLTDDAPLAVVEAAYRALAKQAHPDAGGNHEAAKAINAAVALIRDARVRRTGAA